jgi:hypothetical protein
MLQKLSNIIFLGAFVFASTDLVSQTRQDTSCNVDIFIKEFNVYVQGKVNFNNSAWLNNGDSLSFFLYDCKGAMRLKLMNRKGKVKEEGEFINSLDTLKEYTTLLDSLGIGKIIISQYFEPLKQGEWKYYDVKTGKLIKKETYTSGILNPVSHDTATKKKKRVLK